MTPKEKAKYLIKDHLSYFGINDDATEDEKAKQSAFKTVIEIIKNLELIHKPEYVNILIQNEYVNIYDAIEYWDEVLDEIKKL